MDGTYLAWIDFGAYIRAEDMHDLFENKCRLAPSFGEWFGGESYATFVRLNLATSLENIKIATHNIIKNIWNISHIEYNDPIQSYYPYTNLVHTAMYVR